jgi:hypothetical protein
MLGARSALLCHPALSWHRSPELEGIRRRPSDADPASGRATGRGGENQPSAFDENGYYVPNYGRVSS